MLLFLCLITLFCCFCKSLASEASPQWGGGRKTFVLTHMSIFGCLSDYLMYVRIPGSIRKSLQTLLEKDIVVLEISRKLAMDMLVNDDKNGYIEDQGKKLGYTCDLHS